MTEITDTKRRFVVERDNGLFLVMDPEGRIMTYKSKAEVLRAVKKDAADLEARG